MRIIRGALKSAAVMKAVQVAQREARKPENQRKAKELLNKVISNRGKNARRQP